MKYMLLINQGTALETQAALPQDEQATVWQDYQAINQTPGVTPGQRMAQPDSATTVRVEDGKVLTTDGPFSEAKEQIGGFWVIEAADLDAALALAAEGSAACRGPVEVRPFQSEPPAAD